MSLIIWISVKSWDKRLGLFETAGMLLLGREDKVEKVSSYPLEVKEIKSASEHETDGESF